MRRFVIALFIIACSATELLADAPAGFSWARTWGGAGDYEQVTGLCTDAEGNVFSTGIFRSTIDFDPGPGVDLHTSLGLTNAFVTKYNSDGNFVWAKTFGGPGADSQTGTEIACDGAGNVYVTGNINLSGATTPVNVDFDPGPGTDIRALIGVASYVVKFANNGNYVWAKTFGSSDSFAGLFARDVTIDANNNLYLTGYFAGTVDFDPGPGTDNRTVSSFVYGSYLTRYNSDGTYGWTVAWESSRCNKVATDGAGNVYVTGAFAGLVDFDPGAGTDNHMFSGYRDIFLSKFHPDGSFEWARTWGGVDSTWPSGNWDEGWGLAVGPDNSVYVTGTYSDSVDFDPSSGVDTHTSLGGSDVFLSKFTASGALVWARTWGGTNTDYGNSVTTDFSGGVYVTGAYQNSTDFDAGTGTDIRTANPGFDIFLSRYDSNGAYGWVKAWGGPGWESGFAAVARGGDIYVGGIFYGASIDFDTGSGIDNHSSAGHGDAFLAKYRSAQLTISGVVTANGVPLAGARIGDGTLGFRYTGPSGSFQFNDVTPGTAYLLTASKTGYSFSPSSASGTATNNVVVNFAGTLQTQILSGAVTYQGNPLSGVTINGGPLGSVTTDSSGLYSFPEVPQGTVYTLEAYKSGYSFSPESRSGRLTSDYSAANFAADFDTDGDGVTDSQETSDGTDALDSGSSLCVLRTTVCSEWNGYFQGSMWNIMEHVNMGNATLLVHSVLYTITGEEQGTQDFALPPGTQYDLLVHGMEGWTAQSYGRVCSTITNGNPGDLDGRMVYYKPTDDAGSSYQFAFAMPFLNGVTGKQYVPFNTFDPENAGHLVANWIQVTNLEGSAQGGTLTFFAQDGTVLGSPVPIALSAGARYDISGHQFGANLVGVVEFQPDSDAAKFQLRNIRYYYDNSGATESFRSAFQLEGRVGSGALLAVPLDTTTAMSVLEVVNTAAVPQTIEVKIYKSDGTPLSTMPVNLAAHASTHIITNPILNGTKGLATVQGTIRAGAGALAMQYGRTNAGGLRYIYGIWSQQTLGTTLRGSYNSFLGQGCWLHLINPTAGATSATISLRRFDGHQALSGETFNVPAFGFTDYDLCSRDQVNVYGVATVNAGAPNSLMSTVIRTGSADAYRFPTPVRQ